MDRLAAKIVAAALIALFAAPAAGAGKDAAPPRRKAPARKNADRRLDEVKIVGNPDRPEVLFFLPRAKFRLLPMGAEPDWREEVLRDDIEKAGTPR